MNDPLTLPVLDRFGVKATDSSRLVVSAGNLRIHAYPKGYAIFDDEGNVVLEKEDVHSSDSRTNLQRARQAYLNDLQRARQAYLNKGT